MCWASSKGGPVVGVNGTVLISLGGFKTMVSDLSHVFKEIVPSNERSNMAWLTSESTVLHAPPGFGQRETWEAQQRFALGQRRTKLQARPWQGTSPCPAMHPCILKSFNKKQYGCTGGQGGQKAHGFFRVGMPRHPPASMALATHAKP